MELFGILKLRSTINSRRESQSGISLILAAIGGPLLIIMGMFVYDGAQRYVERHLPVYPLILCAVIVWLIAGVPVQLRLFGDRRWSSFISHMPVGPVHLIAVHSFAGLLLNLVVAILLFCVLWGVGTEWWLLTVGIRWLVLFAAVPWAISMQIVIALIASRFVKVQRIMLALFVLSGMLLAGRVVWTFRGAGGDIEKIFHILATDPLLVVSGIAGFVQTLTATDELLLHSALISLAHMTSLIVVSTMICLCFIRKVPIDNSGYSVSVLLTRWLRKIVGRIMPGPRGGQVVTEWLRTLRGNSARITIYALGGVLSGLIFRIKLQEGNRGLFILTLVAMAMVSDGAVEILGNRRDNKLYDIYGVDSKDYLYGFITSMGLLISAMSLVQIPIFCDANVDWGIAGAVFCVCTAIGFALVGISVSVDYYCRNMRFPNQLFATVLELWRRGLMYMPCFAIAFILLVVGLYNSILPLILAGLFVAADVYRTGRGMVIEQYWKL
jgi:hypothetical protein